MGRGKGSGNRDILLGKKNLVLSEPRNEDKKYVDKATGTDSLEELNIYLNKISEFGIPFGNKAFEANIFRLLNEQRLDDYHNVSPFMEISDLDKTWKAYYSDESKKEILEYLKTQKEGGQKDILVQDKLIVGFPIGVFSDRNPETAEYILDTISNIETLGTITWSHEERYNLLKKLRFSESLWDKTVDTVSKGLFTQPSDINNAFRKFEQASFGADLGVICYKGKKTLHLIAEDGKETLCGQRKNLNYSGSPSVPTGSWQKTLDGEKGFNVCKKCLNAGPADHLVYSKANTTRISFKKKFEGRKAEIIQEGKERHRETVAENLERLLSDDIAFSTYKENTIARYSYFNRELEEETKKIYEELLETEGPNIFWANLLGRKFDPNKEYPDPTGHIDQIIASAVSQQSLYQMNAAAARVLDKIENPDKYERRPSNKRIKSSS